MRKKNELFAENIMNSESEILLKENAFLRSIIGKMVEEFSGNIEKSIAHLQSSQTAFEIIKNQSRIALADAAEKDADMLKKKPSVRLSKSQLLDKKIIEKCRQYELELENKMLPDDPHNILDI